MPLMLTFLTGCILAFLSYFIFVQAAEYHLVWQNAGSQSYTCAVIYFAEMPAFLLLIGIILNVNKWVYFLLRVRAFVRIETETALRRPASDFEELRDSIVASPDHKFSRDASVSSQIEMTTRTKSTTSSLATKHTRFTIRILLLNATTFALIFIVKTA